MSGESVVITGAALATCLGLTREETWRAVLDGRCGMRPFTAIESPLSSNQTGGQALDLPADFRSEQPREVRYLRWTIAQALRDAGAGDDMPYPSQRCGIMLGTTLHGMRAGGDFLRTGNYDPLRNFLASHTLHQSSADLDLTGFAATTCSACSSSLGAIALGVTLLQAGEIDFVVAGGYDTISEYVYGGFTSLRLVADTALRPFAKDRRGMKLAEGYGIVVLERASDARRRSAEALATILGYGESADAHHLTQPHPTGEGAARAISAALADAGVTHRDIDLIAAHATGTPDNDAAEYAAFTRVFGDDLPRVPVVAFKSHLGHTLGGAGAVELILSAMALREQVVPPCANVQPGDVEFPNLNLATGARRPAAIRTTLNTSLGFGGANTCMVLGEVSGSSGPLMNRTAPIRSSGTPRQPGKAQNDVLITGIGVIVPGASNNDAFMACFSDSARCWSHDTGAIPESDYLHLLNARRVRRMSEYVKLTLAATALALRDAKIADVPAFAESTSAILGSTHGSAEFAAAYYGEIVRQGLVGANPVLFAEGVPNAAAAHLSLMLSLKGACQTVIGSRTAGLDALHLAALRIRSGRWDRAIVSAAEEYSPIVNGAYAHCGLFAAAGAGSGAFQGEDGFVTGSAAVTFILESRAGALQRGGTARGRVLAAVSSKGRPNESVESACRVLSDLGGPRAILSSACGTWIDRAESAAIRRAAPAAIVSAPFGYVAEHFSATPLLGLAAVLLSGRLPRLDHAPDGLCGAQGTERPEAVAALCTDFTGCVTGASVALEPMG